MLQSAEAKKLFAKLEEINRRLDALQSNGDVEDIKKAAKTLIANTQGFEATVKSHGAELHRIMRVIERLEKRCPLMRPRTDEFESVGGCDEVDSDHSD